MKNLIIILHTLMVIYGRTTKVYHKKALIFPIKRSNSRLKKYPIIFYRKIVYKKTLIFFLQIFLTRNHLLPSPLCHKAVPYWTSVSCHSCKKTVDHNSLFYNCIVSVCVWVCECLWHYNVWLLLKILNSKIKAKI